MSLTKEERQAMMAKAREAKKNNGEVKLNEVPESEDKAEEVKEEVVVAGKVKYGSEIIESYEMIVEPHALGARVVVTKDGLHKGEWHGSAFECKERARKYIYSGDATGMVNVFVSGF